MQIINTLICVSCYMYYHDERILDAHLWLWKEGKRECYVWICQCFHSSFCIQLQFKSGFINTMKDLSTGQ